MTLALLEGAVTDLDTYLQANMAAKIVALNAEYDDSYSLADIASWYLGNIPMDIPELPSVCLQAPGWTPEEQQDTILHTRSYVNIVVFVGLDNDQARFRHLCRYGRAIVELLNDWVNTSPGYWVRLEGQISISETLAAPPWLQGIVVSISMYPLAGEEY